MSEVVARFVTDSTVHQLEVENGRYTMRLYVRERNADRELTREQAGEWVRYSTPEDGGAEYVAVCTPAFSIDTVHRDDD